MSDNDDHNEQRQGGERLPPQSRSAERSVLGSMLRDNGVIGDVVQVLRAEYFYFDHHRKIYQAVIDLFESGNPADLVILADVLKERGQIDDIGYPYLGELWDAAPTSANAEYYARIVRDRAIARELIIACTEIARDAYGQAAPAEQLLDSAEARIFAIARMGVAGIAVPLRQAVGEAMDRIDARLARDASGAGAGVPTGLVDLDTALSGLQDSELVILAARPSLGKTALAANIALHVAHDCGMPVFFSSIEQHRAEIAERMLCERARINTYHARHGMIGRDDLPRLISAAGDIGNGLIFFDDTPCQSVLRIAANARRLKAKHGMRLVVIDYLQLVDPENRREPRHEQVACISRRLKQLARELACPVLALAQLNRQSEDRQDKKPRLADLRESGSIEADADAVLLLHRPPDTTGVIDVLIEKNRNGPTGTVPLFFRKEFMKFENFSPDRDGPMVVAADGEIVG